MCVFSGNVSNLQDHFCSDINQDVEFIFGKQYTIQYFNLNILFVSVFILDCRNCWWSQPKELSIW